MFRVFGETVEVCHMQ